MAAHGNDDGDRQQNGPEPRVPGHAVVRRLGAGGSGEVWLLQDDDGGRVALKVPLTGPSAPQAAGRALAAERWRVQGMTHPHLLPVRGGIAVERTGPGGDRERGTGLLMDFAPGGSVGSLMAARGTIGSGEVVTLVVPIAQALAYLHSRGIVHGDVSPGNILFSAEGSPLLADFGQAGLTGESRERRATLPFADPHPGTSPNREGKAGTGRRSAGWTGKGRSAEEPAGAAGDVYSLAAVAWWCLMGEPPGPASYRPPLPLLRPDVPGELALALESALNECPADRPSARDFARDVQRACPAVPVQIAAGASREDYRELATALLPGRSGLDARARRRCFRRPARFGVRAGRAEKRPGKRRLVASAVALTLLLGGAILTWQGRSPAPVVQAPSVGRVPDSPQDPVEAARHLVVLRGRALGAQDAALLDAVYRDGPAKSRDRELIDRLRAEHRGYAGYRPVVQNAGLEDGGTADRAVLSVTVATPSFLLSSEPGAGRPKAETKPARTESLRLTLTRVDGVWLIEGVAPRG